MSKFADLFDFDSMPERRVRFLRPAPLVADWRQLVDRGDTPSVMRDGERLEDVLPTPHHCQRAGCLICEGAPRHRVWLTAMVESTPRRLVPTPVKAPRHKKRRWMSDSYHQRTQKKWDARVKGQTVLAPAMEKRVIAVARSTMDQLRKIAANGRTGYVYPPPFTPVRGRPVRVRLSEDGMPIARMPDFDLHLTGEVHARQEFGFRHVVKDEV